MSDLKLAARDGGSETEGMVTAEEVGRIVGADKETALEVIRAAKEQLSAYKLILPHPDITGKPDGIKQFERYKKDQYRNLQRISNSPFFLRVSADLTMDGKTEPTLVLLTEAREVGATATV